MFNHLVRIVSAASAVALLSIGVNGATVATAGNSWTKANPTVVAGNSWTK